jgi:ribosomal protein L16 Arg81 hydroxylase
MAARNEETIARLAVSEQQRFLAEFRLRQPVVLRGGLSTWPETLFDFERLADRFGTQRILSYRIPPEIQSARMSSLKSDFYVWSDQEGNREHLREWTLGEFIAALRAGDSHYCMANRTKNTNLRDILAAETGELDCVPVAGTRHEVARREFFIGSEGAGPGLHHDGAVESFLCQLVGAKRINVFSPRDIPHLYPAASWLALTGHFSAVADSFKVDSGAFPLFSLAKAHRCLLEPGDVLYLPPHWYHDTSPLGPTVTMTIRNVPPPEAWGTTEDRDALARAAENLYKSLERLPPAARMAYSALLRHDLADDKYTQGPDRLPNKG